MAGPAVQTRRDASPLHCLFTATAVGQAGNMMTVVAGPWFVLELTGSPAKTGLVGAALVLGGVVPAVLGGPLVADTRNLPASTGRTFGASRTMDVSAREALVDQVPDRGRLRTTP